MYPIPMNHDPHYDRTRQTLICRLKDLGDRKGWEEFFDTYRRLIFGMAMKSGLTVQESEDALLETVSCVAKGIERYNSDVPFRAWLGRITRCRIADQFRKRFKGIMVSTASDHDGADGADIEQLPDPMGRAFESMWEEEWKEHLIDGALESLKGQVSIKHYQVFYLRAIKKQPVRTVAKALGINSGQVYLIVHRLSPLFKAAVRKLNERKG
jgi:RNA polymerase sigma factor (sigma-70 family)